MFVKLWKNFGSCAKRNCVGVEMTSRYVRVIDLAKKGGALVMSGFGEVRLSSPSPAQTAEAINVICKERRFRAKTANCLTPYDVPFIRLVDMPEMGERELLNSLRFSERDAAPFPLETASIDAWILSRDSRKGRIKALMGALEDSAVKEFSEILGRTHLQPATISAVPAALGALVNESRIIDKSVPVPMISVGDSVIGVYVFHENSIKFARRINIGFGGSINKVSAGYPAQEETFRSLEIVAENFHRIYGAREEAEPQPMDKMAAEIKRSIEYFKNKSRTKNIPAAYIVGSADFLPDLADYLTDALQCRFSVYNPFDDFVTVKKKELAAMPAIKEKGPSLAVLIGATLDSGDRLNLLPVKSRYYYKKFWGRIAPFTAAVFYALFLLSAHHIGSNYLGNLENRIKNMETLLSGRRAERQASVFVESEIAKLRKEIKAVEARMKIYPELKGRSIGWKAVYREIGDILPSGIALEKISVLLKNQQEYTADGRGYSRQIVLKGKIRGDSERQFRDLRLFMERLEASAGFEHVSLLSSRREKNAGSKKLLFFTIAANIKGAQ